MDSRLRGNDTKPQLLVIPVFSQGQALRKAFGYMSFVLFQGAKLELISCSSIVNHQSSIVNRLGFVVTIKWWENSLFATRKTSPALTR